MSEFIKVAKTSDLAPGEKMLVEYDEDDVGIFNINGEFYAISDVCTHDGGVLTGGELEDCIITCPRHGAQFDVRTGEVVTPPAYEPTATFPVRVVEGMVQVTDDRWD